MTGSPGRFITFEGGEGVGKSTQLRLIADMLRGQGETVVTTREPGGTPGAEAIRSLVVSGDTGRWLPLSEIMLFAAARYDHVQRVIKPALTRGDWVLCDRFVDSTTAYQGYGLGYDIATIGKVRELILDGFAPDVTFVLDIEAGAGLARSGERQRYEAMDLGFHQRLRNGFLAIAAGEPGRCVVIDAGQSVETVRLAIVAELYRRFQVAPMIQPRSTSIMLGHEKAEQELADAIAAGRLPHGLIFGGEWGIGKATLAFRLARYLLSPQARVPESLALKFDTPAAHRIAAHSHSDLITIERAADATTGKQSRDVSVEDVRRIAPFLRMTAAEGGWRIAIIDDAAALNRAGQNALLKILEEPPPRTVLVLVCDRPGLLLPTIHSRCRLMHLAPLALGIVDTLLQAQAPEVEAAQRPALAALAEGSIGRALRLAHHEGLPLYAELVALLRGLPDPDWPAIHAFADRLGSPATEPGYRLFGEFVTGWVTRLVRAGAGEMPPEVLPGEADLMRRLLGLTGLDRWIDACENINQRLTATDSANLDRRLAVWSVFDTLARLGARSAA